VGGPAMMGPIDLGVVAGYFAVIIGYGLWAARQSRGVRDFFLGGQRFAWWFVAFSCIATVVGSYSFVKYSAAGFRYGIPSSQTYLNDWFWMPLWMFGWLPLVYYARITSVPEFFERRFGATARLAAMVLLIVYLTGYLGINFLTMGRALEALAGWNLLLAAGIVAVICGVYTSHGGQTAVIFTDLIQGFLLIVAGLGLFAAGLYAVGGPGAFWESLPPLHRQALPPFNRPADFNFVGIFWQDGMAGGIAFYFMNQGILLRFLSARSVGHARKAVTAVLLVLMPLAAVSVSGAGWIGRAMVERGILPATTDPGGIFIDVAGRVLPVGFFGLVVAALIAALMSTADTLINAIATISVVDLWRPWRKRRGRQTGGRRELAAARIASAAATVVGFSLVPLFAGFGSIYRAHGAFTAAVTPPLAVTLVLGFCWKRLSSRAALLVMIGGTGLIALSFAFPVLVVPFSHGIDLEAGSKSYSYIRALYGLVVCTGLGVLGAWIWPERRKIPETLSIGSVLVKMRAFKGGANPRPGPAPRVRMVIVGERGAGDGAESEETPVVKVPRADATTLQVNDGDLVSLWEAHWFRGGYKALTGRVALDDGTVGEVRVEDSYMHRLRMKERTAVYLRRLM